MLEVGAVVDAGRQQRDGRIGVEVARCDAFERFQKRVGIVLDGPDAIAAEEIREKMHHRFAVLEHVGDAGGRARVVLEHHEVVLAGADEIDADDMTVDAARRVDADHLGQKRRVLDDKLFGNLAGLQDLLAMIDVVQEGVERPDALLDALLEAAPLVRRDDARQDVERDQAARPPLRRRRPRT